jgi:hypothetical protein
VKAGALFVACAIAPSLLVLAYGALVGGAHGHAIALGGASAAALALVGALLVAWPPVSLRWAAIAAAAAFAARIGGAGAIGFLLLAAGMADATSALAAIAVGIGGALAVELMWWIRALRRAIAIENAVESPLIGNTHHA